MTHVLGRNRSVIIMLMSLCLGVFSLVFPTATPLAQSPTSQSATLNIDGLLGTTINTRNGNLQYTRDVMFVRGGLVPIDVKLVYNSVLSGRDWGFGGGWKLNYNVRYSPTAEAVFVEMHDGQVLRFARNGGGFVAPTGFQHRLARTDRNGFVLTTPDGVVLRFDNPQHRYLTSIEHRTGGVTQLSYDGNNRLEAITNPFGGRVQFVYNNNRLTTITDPETTISVNFAYADNGRLQSINHPNNTRVQFVYAEGLLTAITNERNATATIAYSGTAVTQMAGLGQFIELDYQDSVTRVAVDGVTTVYRYNESDQVTRIVDALGNIQQLEWNPQGRLVAFTTADGRTTRFTYNAAGALTRREFPDGTTQTFTYVGGDSSLVESVPISTDPDAPRYTYAWDDSLQLVRRITNPAGETIELDYDGAGNITAMTDAAGNILRFGYTPRGDLTVSLNANGQERTYQHDDAGNLIGDTDAAGNTTLRFYDIAGKMTAIITPDNQPLTYAYDESGNVVRITNSGGQTTTYDYDAANRLTQVTNPNGEVTRYEYNAQGQLVTTISSDGTQIRYIYDVIGRLTSRVDPNGNTINYSYNPQGQVVTQTDSNNNTVQFAYDERGRLIRKSYPDDTSVNYTYDSANRLVAVQSAAGMTRFDYDAVGRLARAMDVNGNVVSYEYDPRGLLASIVYPDGSEVRYDYDEIGQRRAVDAPNGSTFYTYNPTGQIDTVSLPNGLVGSYEYTPGGQLTRIRYTNTAGDTVLSFDYQLGANPGQWLGETTTRNGISTTTDYRYDALRQLVEARTLNGDTLQYQYDARGNRTSVADASGVTAVAYDRANRIIFSSAPDNTRILFTHDANGNIIERTSGVGRTTYRYNFDNQLVEINDGTSVTEFVYDGLGQLVATIVDGQRTNVVNDVSGNLTNVLALQADGQFSNVVYGNGAVSQDARFYLRDGRASITDYTDTDGALVESYNYSPYGMLQSVDEPLTYFGYAGHMMLGDLLYMRSRFYDPQLGRFMQRDSFNGYLTESQSLNGYAYAYNNPVNLVDPIGHVPVAVYGSFLSQLDNRVQNMSPLAAIQQLAVARWSPEGLGIFPFVGNIVDGQSIITDDKLNPVARNYLDDTALDMGAIHLMAAVHPVRSIAQTQAILDGWNKGRYGTMSFTQAAYDYDSVLAQAAYTEANVPNDGAFVPLIAATDVGDVLPPTSVDVVPVTVLPVQTQATDSVAAAPTDVPLTPTPAPRTDVLVQPNIGSGVNIRSGPGTNNPVVGAIRREDTAVLLDQNAGGDWYNVRINDGTVGWVFAPLVDIIPPEIVQQPSATPTMQVTATNTPSATATPTATLTLTATHTATVTNTATLTSIATPTATATATPTQTPEPDVTSTESTAGGGDFAATATALARANSDDVADVATETPSPTATATDEPTPSHTPTDEPLTPTLTATPSATNTATPTLTHTATLTPTLTLTPKVTSTPTITPTPAPVVLDDGTEIPFSGIYAVVSNGTEACSSSAFNTEPRTAPLAIGSVDEGDRLTILNLDTGISLTYNKAAVNAYDIVVPSVNAIETLALLSPDAFITVRRSTSGCIILTAFKRVASPEEMPIVSSGLLISAPLRAGTLCNQQSSLPPILLASPVTLTDNALVISGQRYPSVGSNVWEATLDSATVQLRRVANGNYNFGIDFESAMCVLSGQVIPIDLDDLLSNAPDDNAATSTVPETTPSGETITATPVASVLPQAGVYSLTIGGVEGCAGVGGTIARELQTLTEMRWAFSSPGTDEILVVNNALTGLLDFTDTFFSRIAPATYIRLRTVEGVTTNFTIRIVSETEFQLLIETGSACLINVNYILTPDN